MLNIIVAHTRRGGIGIGNKIPWELPKDMKFFKKMTIGDGNNSVIMGRKTWESIPCNYKPLVSRKNIIISTTMEDTVDNGDIKICRSLGEAIDYCDDKKYDYNWIVGGARLYDFALNNYLVDRVYITKIDENISCDTFFPRIDDDFYKASSSDTMTDNDINFVFECHKRKSYRSDELALLAMF